MTKEATATLFLDPPLVFQGILENSGEFLYLRADGTNGKFMVTEIKGREDLYALIGTTGILGQVETKEGELE